MGRNSKIALLVSFGNFLLKDRETREVNPNQHDVVSDADISNFLNEQNSNLRSLNFGEKAVGLSFNPSGDDAVGEAKQLFADAINQMNDLRMNSESGEQKRLASVAITEAQAAQMWAVKAITWKD